VCGWLSDPAEGKGREKEKKQRGTHRNKLKKAALKGAADSALGLPRCVRKGLREPGSFGLNCVHSQRRCNGVTGRRASTSGRSGCRESRLGFRSGHRTDVERARCSGEPGGEETSELRETRFAARRVGGGICRLQGILGCRLDQFKAFFVPPWKESGRDGEVRPAGGTGGPGHPSEERSRTRERNVARSGRSPRQRRGESAPRYVSTTGVCRGATPTMMGATGGSIQRSKGRERDAIRK